MWSSAGFRAEAALRRMRVLLCKLADATRAFALASVGTVLGFMQAASDIEQKIWEKLLCNVFVGGVPSPAHKTSLTATDFRIPLYLPELGTCVVTDFTVGKMVDNRFSKQVALTCAQEAAWGSPAPLHVLPYLSSGEAV